MLQPLHSSGSAVAVGLELYPPGPFSLQYKTCKDGSVLGVTVTRIALLTHCQALTQACGYTEGMGRPLLGEPDPRSIPERCVLCPPVMRRVRLSFSLATLTVHLLDCLVGVLLVCNQNRHRRLGLELPLLPPHSLEGGAQRPELQALVPGPRRCLWLCPHRASSVCQGSSRASSSPC